MTQETTTKKPATQEFVAIDEIRDNVVILRNGGLRAVLMCGSRNLELESIDSQNAIIAAYADFVNSFDWPIQIAVHSRRLDIGPYLAALDERLKIQTNELLKIQTAEYIDFIKSFVSLSDVMVKKFYTIVPYEPAVLGSGGPLGPIGSLFKKSSPQTAMPEEKFKEYERQLQQRVEHIVLSLAHVGIKSIQLQTDELVELFYNLYNPEELEKKGIQITNQVQ